MSLEAHMADKDTERILCNYIIRGRDPYFSQGNRSNLRYVTMEYIYAVLMEPNRRGVDVLDYLYFAKADLLSKDLRGAINALGNAKRAIHLLVDCFLELLGLKRIYSKDNFPAKLEIVKKLEAFPTKLLMTLNERRNLIEHGYDQIELHEAEDFVEIAEVFVKLCYPYFGCTTVGARIGEVNSDKDIEWLLDPLASEITVSECQGASKLETGSYGTIYYNLKTKPEKTVVKSIRMTKMNTAEWIPILNTFLYGTQRRRMSRADVPPYEKEDYRRIMKFSVEHLV